MPPRYLVDSERSLRHPIIQDQFRFWVIFDLKSQRYKRWFTSKSERDWYLYYEVPNALLVSSGELPRQIAGDITP